MESGDVCYSGWDRGRDSENLGFVPGTACPSLTLATLRKTSPLGFVVALVNGFQQAYPTWVRCTDP